MVQKDVVPSNTQNQLVGPARYRWYMERSPDQGLQAAYGCAKPPVLQKSTFLDLFLSNDC